MAFLEALKFLLWFNVFIVNQQHNSINGYSKYTLIRNDELSQENEH